jgi:hypothetical protein
MRLGVFNHSLFLEFRQTSLKAVQGDDNIVIPIERQANGRLTPGCKEKVTASLQGFIKKKNWQPRLRAVCAIEARGVSLRRLNIPANARQDLQGVLRLQIESEFPLPPDELAWGYVDQAPAVAENGKREFTVVAVKKDIVEDYARILAACGISPMFTLAALARTWTRAAAEPGTYAVLDIGRQFSELITFENGAPSGLRILNWGGDHITHEIQQRLGVTHEQAEKLKLEWDDGPGTNGEIGKTVQAAIGVALGSLAAAINEAWSGPRLLVTGRSTSYNELPEQLSQLLGGNTRCERLEGTAAVANGGSAAILGLQSTARLNGGEPPLVLQLKEGRSADSSSKTGLGRWTVGAKALMAQPLTAKWVRMAAILVVAAIFFPFIEALALKPLFAKKLAALKLEKARLPIIDRELSFLQYLKQNQPPYLDAMTVIACSVSGGTRFESIGINRHGELSLKGNLKDANQVSDFRAKLIKSGYFSSVTVEEQAPSQDRQKVMVRMTAQIKPLAARGSVSVDTILSNAPPVQPGSGGFGGPEMMFPGGGMPMPMPMPGGPARPPSNTQKSPSPSKMDKGSNITTRTIKVGDQTVEISPGPPGTATHTPN